MGHFCCLSDSAAPRAAPRSSSVLSSQLKRSSATSWCCSGQSSGIPWGSVTLGAPGVAVDQSWSEGWRAAGGAGRSSHPSPGLPLAFHFPSFERKEVSLAAFFFPSFPEVGSHSVAQAGGSQPTAAPTSWAQTILPLEPPK